MSLVVSHSWQVKRGDLLIHLFISYHIRTVNKLCCGLNCDVVTKLRQATQKVSLKKANGGDEWEQTTCTWRRYQLNDIIFNPFWSQLPKHRGLKGPSDQSADPQPHSSAAFGLVYWVTGDVYFSLEGSWKDPPWLLACVVRPKGSKNMKIWSTSAGFMHKYVREMEIWAKFGLNILCFLGKYMMEKKNLEEPKSHGDYLIILRLKQRRL